MLTKRKDDQTPVVKCSNIKLERVKNKVGLVTEEVTLASNINNLNLL